MKRAGAACLLIVFVGCGYVGEPLPPALNVPLRVTDLSVVEIGSRIVVQFSMPQRTTEGLEVTREEHPDLYIGDAGPAPFNSERWAAAATVLPDVSAGMQLPIAPWQGRDLMVGLKVRGPKRRDAGFSNLVPLHVTPPVSRPEGLRAEAVAAGVRLTWTGQAPGFNIYRLAKGEKTPTLLGAAPKSEYVDTSALYEKTYQYSVQATDHEALSQMSAPFEITPVDKFAPAIPAGLSAVTGANTVELVWERNTESDLAGYRIYRSEAGGPFRVISGSQEAPNYSDHAVESGKRYRYAVSSFDKVGNESAQSAPVEAVAP